MSFNLYSQARLEDLTAILAGKIRNEPLNSVFTAETICVSHPQVQKWLQIQLALLNGIEANNHYPLAANLIWSLLKKAGFDCPDQDPLALEQLTWRIFTLLPKVLEQDGFSLLKSYLKKDPDAVKQWLLAEKIANVLDRYQYYHADTLQQWQQQPQGWFGKLWQKISHNVSVHKLVLLDQFAQAVKMGKVTPEHLPQRVHIFAPASMPGVVLDFFYQLSQVIEVNFYLFSPTEHYWADLVSPKKQQRAILNNQGDYLDTGNALLSSWGMVGQQFHAKLSALEQAHWFQGASSPAEDHSLLNQLQQDIYNLVDANQAEKIRIDNDFSIELHQCHGAMRECQLLHDRILSLLDSKGSTQEQGFAENPLKLQDILVMAPNISDYVPYIEAVFSPSADKPYLPFNINDVSVAEQSPLVSAFLSLLQLDESRFRQSDILPLLAVEALQQRFGFSAENLEQITLWLKQSAIRWGKDAQHKKQLGLPAEKVNTWQFGLDRLMASYAMGDFAQFEDLVSVGEIDGNQAELLGRFMRFYQQLCLWSEKLQSPRTPRQWQLLLNQLLDDFFVDDEQQGAIFFIREQIDQWLQLLAELDSDIKINTILLRKVLGEKLQTRQASHAFMSSGITFSSLKPMRALPFRVIIVLGMNEEVFPRKQVKADFDVLTSAEDFSLAQEDRYLFLETLLSAREKLILSYRAFDPKNNQSKPASILIDELMDYIDQRFISSKGEKLSSLICFNHHLQPWHPDYYQNSARWQSYDRFYLPIVEPDQEKLPHYQNWQNLPQLETAPVEQIYLSDLLRFYRNPAEAFVKNRLKIRFDEQQVAFEDNEPISLDGLQAYQIKQRLLDGILHKDAKAQTEALIDQLQQRFYYEGFLPPGNVGKSAFYQQVDKVKKAINILQGFDTEGVFSHAFQLKFKHDGQKEIILIGQLTNLYPQTGLLKTRPGEVKGTDLLRLWIEHLLLTLLRQSVDLQSYHSIIVDDKKTHYFPQDCVSYEQAEQYLEELLRLYLQGMQQPLPLFPQSSYHFAEQLAKGKEPSVYSQWHGGWNNTGDKDNDYIALLCRQLKSEPIDEEVFRLLADRVYQPVIRHCHH